MHPRLDFVLPDRTIVHALPYAKLTNGDDGDGDNDTLFMNAVKENL